MNEHASTIHPASTPAPPSQPLHLTNETDADTLPLERRSYRRRAVQQQVSAAVTSRDAAHDTAMRICSLTLTDLSPIGAGAMVQEALPPGAQITVFCPPHGAEPGFDLQGTIVRCRPNPDNVGYHVGIHIEARLAA